jgi:hypothetical protein
MSSRSLFAGLTLALLVLVATGCGDAASNPAPKASSITGTITPPTTQVGQPVVLTFEMAGFSRDIKTLALDFDGDLADHHVIQGVTAALDGGSPTDCSPDPNNGKFYDCGGVKKAQKAEVTITAVPKDAGNFKPDVLFSDGVLGSGSQTFDGANSVMGFTETVNPA